MKRLVHRLRHFRDDRGQALTEFALVIPVVLLFFFAVLQHLENARVSQMVTYAAFAAARSYAVHASVDGEAAARGLAAKAAAVALSPVARLVPGELYGAGTVLSGALPAGAPSALGKTAALGLGYACAFWRLNSQWWGGGGSINIGTSGSGPLRQVDVRIDYPQPIFIPGLAEMWSVVAGTDIHASLAPLGAGLGGVPGATSRTLEDYQNVREELARIGIDLPKVPEKLLLHPYALIRGVCSMGYEDWGGRAAWRPRLECTVDAATAVDEDLKRKEREKQEAACDYRQAARDHCRTCCDLRARYQEWKKAEEEYQRVKSQGMPPEVVAYYKSILDRAYDALKKAQGRYLGAYNREKAAGERYEDVFEGQIQVPKPSSCPEKEPPPAGCSGDCDSRFNRVQGCD